MDLPLNNELRFGWATFMDSLEAVHNTTALADELGLDSLWVGDHRSRPRLAFSPSTRLPVGGGPYCIFPAHDGSLIAACPGGGL